MQEVPGNEISMRMYRDILSSLYTILSLFKLFRVLITETTVDFIF